MVMGDGFLHCASFYPVNQENMAPVATAVY